MDYFIPRHMKGRTPSGAPYQFFRGIHAVPDDLANSPEANRLGIVPVEEMADGDWAKLGLTREAWMAEHRPKLVEEKVKEPDPAPVAPKLASTPAPSAVKPS